MLLCSWFVCLPVSCPVSEPCFSCDCLLVTLYPSICTLKLQSIVVAAVVVIGPAAVVVAAVAVPFGVSAPFYLVLHMMRVCLDFL